MALSLYAIAAVVVAIVVLCAGLTNLLQSGNPFGQHVVIRSEPRVKRRPSPPPPPPPAPPAPPRFPPFDHQQLRRDDDQEATRVRSEFASTGVLPSRYRLRHWRRFDGAVKWYGRLTRVQMLYSDSAMLELLDGTTMLVSLISLHEEDRRYIENVHTSLRRHGHEAQPDKPKSHGEHSGRRGPQHEKPNDSQSRSSQTRSNEPDGDQPRASGDESNTAGHSESNRTHTTGSGYRGASYTYDTSSYDQARRAGAGTSASPQAARSTGGGRAQSGRPPSKVCKHYKLLGLDDYTSLTQSRERYHQLAKEWHPDRHQNGDVEEAEKQMKQLTHAWKEIERFWEGLASR